MLLLLLTFLSFAPAQPPAEIKTSVTRIENAVLDYDIEIQQTLVPKGQLEEVSRTILAKEKNIQNVTIISNDGAVEQTGRIAELAAEQGLAVRLVSEEKLNAASKRKVSLLEQNTLRVILVVRCVGLGTGFYVNTGGNIGYAAFAGILNFALMEALYIPTKEGKMHGVDLVNFMMSKAAKAAKKIKPDLSYKAQSRIETATNILSQYTMNFINVLPYLAMFEGNLSAYAQAFMGVELYRRALIESLWLTGLSGSWKMAMSRWQELKVERGIKVASEKTQSRLVNLTDMVDSFAMPGFWAGDPISTVFVVAKGVTGYIALTYHDLRERFKKPILCRSKF